MVDKWTQRKEKSARKTLNTPAHNGSALELMCLVKTNSISGMLIGSLSEKAGGAETKARTASDKSSLAETRADAAIASASSAATSANEAGIVASAAKQKAEEAGKEIAEVKKEAVKLREQNLATEEQLDSEHKTRMQLEASLNLGKL